MSLVVIGLWLIGYTCLCCCKFTDWLLQDCSCWCTKKSNRQVTACVKCGCMCHHWHAEVWPWPGLDTARWTSLARHPRPGVFQAGSDSSTMSERLSTTVPVGLLRTDRRFWLLVASAFRQPSTTCSTSLPAQHLRPSGLFSCRPHSLELSSSGTRPSVQTVPDVCLKRICSLDTSAFSALRGSWR